MNTDLLNLEKEFLYNNQQPSKDDPVYLVFEESPSDIAPVFVSCDVNPCVIENVFLSCVNKNKKLTQFVTVYLCYVPYERYYRGIHYFDIDVVDIKQEYND